MPWEGHPRTTTTPHREWARAILQRDPTCRCQGCRRCNNGCTQPSEQADHIIAGGPLTMTNGQGLCRPCHAAKSSAEGNAARWAVKQAREPEQHPGLR